jgi:hypothetical protein
MRGYLARFPPRGESPSIDRKRVALTLKKDIQDVRSALLAGESTA